MSVLVLLALAAALVGVIAYAMRAQRLRETPKELRGDWWPRFEEEFREYARGWEAARGIRRKSRGHRPRSPRERSRRDFAEGSF